MAFDYGREIEAGARVELSPSLDRWMMGDKFGQVRKVEGGEAYVQLDVSRRVIRVLITDIRRL